MDGQNLTKLPGKLITRSKSKTSVGDRQLVNFLENLSKDETGAPIKWKFNKSGVRFAKGIGKKLADVSKSSRSSLYVDSTVKIARSLLKKHVKKHITDQSVKKNVAETPETNNSAVGIIKRKRGRPRKTAVSDNHNTDGLGNSQFIQESEKYKVDGLKTSQPAAEVIVKRKRGRPRKNVAEAKGKSEPQTDVDSRNWTHLNKKVFQQSLQGIALKKAFKVRCSSEERGDSDRIDSEMETESVDSNISSTSDSRKPKKHYRYGIKLGPRKLLRSQDNLVTRHSKVVSNATMKAIRKPRKRTLSGEFELLDESSLRKKIKQTEEAESVSQSAEHKVEDDKLQEISNPSAAKKRGQPAKSTTDKFSISKTDSDTNVNIESKSEQIEEPETFSVKSMKHPSLLRKQEVRNINLKKHQYETSPYITASLPVKESPEKVVKRGPGRPKSKFSSSSNSTGNTQVRPGSQGTPEKKALGQNSKPPQASLSSPLRGLQIVGPGGMKFTKKPKITDNTMELKKEMATQINKTASLNSSEMPQQNGNLISQSGDILKQDSTLEHDQPLQQPEKSTSQYSQSLQHIEEPTSLSSQAFDLNAEPTSQSSKALQQTAEPTSQSSQALEQTAEPTSQSSQALEQTAEPTSQSSQAFDQTAEPTSQCIQAQFLQKEASASEYGQAFQQTEKSTSEHTETREQNKELILQYNHAQQKVEISTPQYSQAQQQAKELQHEEKSDIQYSKTNSDNKQIGFNDEQKLEDAGKLERNFILEENERPDSETLVVSVISEYDNSHIEKEPNNTSDETTEKWSNHSTQQCYDDFITERVDEHSVCTANNSKKDAIIMPTTVNNKDNTLQEESVLYEGECEELPVFENIKSSESDGDSTAKLPDRPLNTLVSQQLVDDVQSAKETKETKNFDNLEVELSTATELISTNKATEVENISKEGKENILTETKEQMDKTRKDILNEQLESPCETVSKSNNLKANNAISKEQDNETENLHGNKYDDDNLINVSVVGENSMSQDITSDMKMNGCIDSGEETLDKTKQHLLNDCLMPDNSGDKAIKEEHDILQVNLNKNSTAVERVKTPSVDGDKRASSPEIDNQSHDGGMDSSPELNLKTCEKHIPEKRQIQLRQKASRSPLEIIAMRQSQEERQYILEQTQKAIKREEKQKKMKEKHRKILEDERDREKDTVKVCNRFQDKEETDSDNSTEEEQEMKETTVECKQCSVVLIDFVKYLKNSSYSIQSGSVLEEWETVEDTDAAVSSVDSSEPTVSDQEIVTAPLRETEENNDLAKTTDDQNDDRKADESKPVKRKRRASARKQVRSITYSAQLTAEIVSNPMLLFNDESQTTVPPLRLKIKQNIVAKPKFHRQKKGLKFTSKKQHKARKGMSPAKKNPTPAYIDSAISNDEPDIKKQKIDEMNGEGFVGSFVQFIQNRDERKATKDPKSSTVPHRRSTRGQQNNTLTSGETLVSRYKCTFKSCQFVATTKSVIESHIYVHLKNTPFQCLHCNAIFKNRVETCSHIRSMHQNCDMKIRPAESVDERLYYEEFNINDKVVDTSTNASVTSASKNCHEAAIVKVVLPQNVTDSVGCYYCSYCDYSASNQQEVLDHIQDKHDHGLLYACSICNTSVQGSKEDIVNHFADVHPNQQVVYKCLPEFSDSTKNNQDGLNQDKGNIFERMNDLFTQPEQGKKPAFPQKTSAEADSTTVESEEHPHTDKSIAVHDTIQHLEQDKESKSDRLTSETQQSDSSEDMCLKIVDVVSLRDQMPEEWLGDQDAMEGKSASTTPKQASDPQKSVSIIDTVRTGGRLQQRPRGGFPPLGTLSRMSHSREMKNMNIYGTTYKCERCNVHAPVLSAMVEHLRVTHKDIARLFLCPFCRQYEGVSELEIHRHIKQFHHSPCQKSPPVALSAAAKKHLRTIQVPVGDAKKIGDKYVIEKDIYKCLKCQKHMPTLDYIYDHLEKTHNEVFVYVCPYCKLFKSKKEEIVYHHIRKDHDRNATDIMLSLAIEENLFTRIQSLVKDKQKQGQKTQSSPHPQSQQRPTQKRSGEEDVIVVGESRPQAVINQINNVSQATNQQVPNLQLISPMSVTQHPIRMPLPPSDKQCAQISTAARSPVPSLSKSSLRKSRPHHIPQTNPQKPIITSQEYERNIQTMDQNTSKETSLQPHSSVAPPPLIRGPPPLLRFPQDVQSIPQNNIQQVQSQQNRHVVNTSSYSMGKQLNNYHSKMPIQSPALQQPTLDNATRGFTRHARPVLKVPSITQQYNRQQAIVNPNISVSVQNMPQRQVKQTFTSPARPDGAAPLDLSRPISEKQMESKTTQPDDELPPDAFQIFNLRPALQRMPTNRPITPGQNMNRFSYPNRMQPPVQTIGRMHLPRYHAPQMIARHPPPYSAVVPSMVNKNVLPPQHILGKPNVQTLQRPPSQSVSPTVDGLNKDQNLAKDDERVFKCPYCPNIVPLGMGEVAPHTEKFHPGHSIVFMKIDKAS